MRVDTKIIGNKRIAIIFVLFASFRKSSARESNVARSCNVKRDPEISGVGKINGDFCAEANISANISTLCSHYYINFYRHANRRARKHDRELIKI